MGHSCNFDGIEFFATWRATNVRCHENADADQRGARTSPVLSLTHVTRHSPSVSYLNLRVSHLSADPFARLGPVRDPHVRTRAIHRRRKHERYSHLRKPKLHKCPFTHPDSRAQHMKGGPHQTTYKIRKPARGREGTPWRPACAFFLTAVTLAKLPNWSGDESTSMRALRSFP
ncbi:hypothetical protein BHE74_00006952 [Ensete ventricosum]|nr:hypothetical protein BHE74_00006952 [Ensete ventricosum]